MILTVATAETSMFLPPPQTAATATVTVHDALSVCTALNQIKQVHAHILRAKLDHRSNSLLFNLVLSSSSLSLSYALSVFSSIPSPPPPHLSNRLLRQLSRSGEPGATLLFYQRIRNVGGRLDDFSFPPLLKAAAKVSGLVEGMEIHGVAVKLGLVCDPVLETGLVDMYASCGRIADARKVFDKMRQRDVVAWNTMIDGYNRHSLLDDVFKLFEEMKVSSVMPDEMILCNIVKACGRAGNLSYGKAIHEYILENNVKIDAHLQGALVTMYASSGCMDMARQLFLNMSRRNLVVSTAMVSGFSKVGRIDDARALFDQMEEKDLVCWSAMISVYAESDQPQEALKIFEQMRVSGMEPDQVTMLSVISACASLGSLEQAKWVHLYIDHNGFGSALPINNALIDMHAKCGNLERARDVFQKMQRRNVISWTSMINAFAIYGEASDALNLFIQMKEENVEPNSVTFVGLLYACSHTGLVEEGEKIFAAMVGEHKITPKHEHYGCMVDLFGRANRLRDALELIESMPMAPNVFVWGSLMSACRVHNELELGQFAAKRVLELEPNHDGALVLLSHFYARERRWDDVRNIRQLMEQKHVFKEKGFSRIDVNGKPHMFLMADKRHKQSDEIYRKLNEVVSELKLVGYAQNVHSVLIDIELEEKKDVVLWHSEKLALCYALLNGQNGPCIRIVKNLRVCEDCHTFIKLVSKVYEREIIVRDRTRFHRFKDGLCSCRDYW